MTKDGMKLPIMEATRNKKGLRPRKSSPSKNKRVHECRLRPKIVNFHNELIPVRVFSTCRGREQLWQMKTNYIYTHVVRWRHGDDGGLRGQNHVSQRSALVYDLLDHVTGGHLHWHRDGRRRIRGHHRHSHRAWKKESTTRHITSCTYWRTMTTWWWSERSLIRSSLDTIRSRILCPILRRYD
jgi:hypothetical protein